MKAQFVSENIKFQRGEDPRATMRIGKHASKLLKALLDSPLDDKMLKDSHTDWMGEQTPEVWNLLDWDPKNPDPENYYAFDADYYLENEAEEGLELEDFEAELEERGWGGMVKGRLNSKFFKGGIKNGPPIVRFYDGMSDGFILKKDWLDK